MSKRDILTPQNSQLIFIDHQPQMAFGVQSIHRQTLKNNTVSLAKAARIFDIPTTIITVETESFSGHTYPEFLDVFPEAPLLERSSMNSWDDQKVRDALLGHASAGATKVVAAGLWTEVCNCTFALSCLADTDLEIYMVGDASGGTIKEAHDLAMQRMMQVGVVPVTWQQVLLEWQRDWARRDTYDAVIALVKEHYGAYGMGVDYAYTMIHKAPQRSTHTRPRHAPVPAQALGTDADMMRLRGEGTQIVGLDRRRVIPGLSYNMELRWENVPSAADALAMLRRQAANTPAPQWVRVIGGWSEFQFAERRMPTLDEIDEAAPDTPVFILHLYASALLNHAALRVLGITRDTVKGEIERDAKGNPTGMLIAKPSALILCSTLAGGPKLPIEDKINSTRHFMRELNRLGVTSVIGAGGGGQNYPQDYDVVQRLHRDGQLTLCIAYNLFVQTAGQELSDYERCIGMTEPGAGDVMLRMNGAGENQASSAADFENFLEPRSEPGQVMEAELERIVELLATSGWPFRIHATYDETIVRFLTVFERVNGRMPFRTRFIIDHAETINRARSLLEIRVPESKMGGLAPWQIKRIERYIHDQMEHGITLGDLSDLVRLSTSHFCKAFKESFGTSPLAHVQAKRIARAKDLILKNDRPLAEIALDCGFRDQAHFSRLFRKLTGLSPSLWRKMYVTEERA